MGASSAVCVAPPRSPRDPPSVPVMAVAAPWSARRHGGERPRQAFSALELRLLGPQHLPQGGGRRGGLWRPLRLASSVGPPWRARGVWRSARTRPRSAARRAFLAVLFVALSSGARRQQPPAPCTCQPKGERAVIDRATDSARYGKRGETVARSITARSPLGWQVHGAGGCCLRAPELKAAKRTGLSGPNAARIIPRAARDGQRRVARWTQEIALSTARRRGRGLPLARWPCLVTNERA